MERTHIKPVKSLLAAMMIAPAGWANAPSGGDELSLADLLQIKVRSAGFFSMDATKAPGSIFVISPDMIRNSPARDLSELLDLVVPGTAMGHHEMHGPLAGVRGILIDNSSKTLVMRDGQAMNARTAMAIRTTIFRCWETSTASRSSTDLVESCTVRAPSTGS